MTDRAVIRNHEVYWLIINVERMVSETFVHFVFYRCDGFAINLALVPIPGSNQRGQQLSSPIMALADFV